MALAARNSGGTVIAQVQERVGGSFTPARLARIPGVLVDAIVVDPAQRQSQLADYDPTISGEAAMNGAAPSLEVPEGIRRIVAERAARELVPGASVNFGYGIPGGIPGLMAEKGLFGELLGQRRAGHPQRLHARRRHVRRRPPSRSRSSPRSTSSTSIPAAASTSPSSAWASSTREGNVNVSMLGNAIVGPGGFVDITQGARKVVFCGTFEAKGLAGRASKTAGCASVSPGSIPKLVGKVRHITFSGARARETGQEVLYVTERAVFGSPGGIELTEVAPGVDLEPTSSGAWASRRLSRSPQPMPLG